MSRNRWYNDRIDEPWHNQAGPGGGMFAAPNQGMAQGNAANQPAQQPNQTPVNPNLNPQNLVAGLASTNAGSPALYTAEIQYQPAIPYQPAVYSPEIQFQPAVPEVPYQSAVAYQPAVYSDPIPEVPGYNPNENAQNLIAGVTNQGTAPNQGCPCEYEMNCWSQTCPSTLSTYTGLPSPNCPPNTQETETNCYVPPVPEVPAQLITAEVPAQAEVQYQPAQPEIPYQAPQLISAEVPAQAEVPYQAPQLITSAIPQTYNMNCWSQTCPSTLSEYANQPSANCPANTQVNETNCNYIPANQNQNMAAFSGNGQFMFDY